MKRGQNDYCFACQFMGLQLHQERHIWVCRRSAPGVMMQNEVDWDEMAAIWPKVTPTEDWCGEGDFSVAETLWEVRKQHEP